MLFRSAILFGVAAHAANTVVQYGAFTQTATYSIANQLGFFNAYGITVNYNQVPNSTVAYANLQSGAYDILTGTIDNAVNLRFNQKQPVTVAGQLDQGPDLVLASIPGITKISQLKGKPLIVDSPLSGYAFLLRKVLKANGLLLENGDYTFMTVGGTDLRYAALVNGQLANGTAVYASIVTYPFTGENNGNPPNKKLNILARVSDVVNPISSSALTIRQATVTDCDAADKAERFIGAMYSANQLLNNPSPSKKVCAIAAIAKQLGVSLQIAALEYQAATSKVSGEISPPKNDFTVNQQGLNNIIAVRSEFGGFSGAGPNFNFAAGTKPGPGQLIDYSIRDAALKRAQLLNFFLSKVCP